MTMPVKTNSKRSKCSSNQKKFRINHFSTAREQWQNGPAESTINSIMLITRTDVAESGLGGRFWFKAAMAGVNARNTSFKVRIWTMPHHHMYGKKKDISGFQAFGCRAWICFNQEHCTKRKDAPRTVEAIYIGFAINKSAWSFIFLK